MRYLLEPFAAPFMRLALVELVLLSIVGGLLGAPIVLRGLAFFTHAAGTVTFPGLVVAPVLGVAPRAAALVAAGACAGCLELLARRTRAATDAATALALVGALAAGVILASDIVGTGGGVEALLFGTLIGLDSGDVAASAGAAVLVVGVTLAFGRTWLASGLDERSARASGASVTAADRVLALTIAVAVVVALDAVGALLVSALFVLPAATARLYAPSLGGLQLAAVALAGAQGTAGLWLAYRLDAPPGPTIAVVGGAVFALAATTRRLWR